MPDYIVKVDFETVRAGQVELRLRSDDAGLTQAQVQELFNGLESDTEFAETLEAGNGKIDTGSPVCRILNFQQSKVASIGPIDLDLDEYEIPGVE